MKKKEETDRMREGNSRETTGEREGERNSR